MQNRINILSNFQQHKKNRGEKLFRATFKVFCVHLRQLFNHRAINKSKLKEKTPAEKSSS